MPVADDPLHIVVLISRYGGKRYVRMMHLYDIGKRASFRVVVNGRTWVTRDGRREHGWSTIFAGIRKRAVQLRVCR